MYLSRIQFDLTKRKSLRCLSDPNMIHGIVERSFHGERKRNLWRVDFLSGEKYLLILSEEKPDLVSAIDQIGVEGSGITKDYAPLLNRIEAGSKWNFRLSANPTRSVLLVKGERGIVKPHVSEKFQRQWLINKSSKCGFSVLENELFIISRKKWHFWKSRGQKPVILNQVIYEGFLTITDTELFREAMIKGIGRGKAYGMGLLTIAGGK